MKQVTLNIPDSKYQFFMELVESLDFAKVDKEDLVVPEWQKKIVRERIKNTKPEDYLSWEEVEHKLKFD